MTRMSKQGERRSVSPRKRHYSLAEKTGPKKDQLECGYRKHENAIPAEKAHLGFIPKIK